jgi:hypothetical protein
MFPLSSILCLAVSALCLVAGLWLIVTGWRMSK